jgi:appr-1-p processing
MLNIELKKSIDEYIKYHFVNVTLKNDFTDESENVTKSGKKLGSDNKVTLDQLMNDIGDSFQDKLFSYIDESGMTDVEVYKKANIDRKLFSKIRSNPMYHPRKQTVLALAIALQLNIEQTVDLLTSAEYALSPGSKGDLIVKYFIEHEIFDIMTINFALDEYGQPILG